jgi:hypothetical protein
MLRDLSQAVCVVCISRHELAKLIFNTSLDPVILQLSARQPCYSTLIDRHLVLDHLRLRPRWHPVEQYFFECPYMVS